MVALVSPVPLEHTLSDHGETTPFSLTHLDIDMLRLAIVLLVLSCPALAVDFVPIEVGNRWVYLHEIFDGQHIGSYSIDTCVVEITAETIEIHAGQTPRLSSKPIRSSRRHSANC